MACCLFVPLHALGQGPGRGGPLPSGPPLPARAEAPIDITGYWVSVVSEDWRYRMTTPPKGDYQGVPMNESARRVADEWDPAADEAAGSRCKSYGAAAIMRVPGRIHITWQDDMSLRLDTDAGMQTRLFRFGPGQPNSEATWQGDSAARWEIAGGGRGRGRGGPSALNAPRFGSLRVVTTNLRAGYLRKNGVPYSEAAVVTEYFDLAPQRNGSQVLVVTTVVDDPQYLQQPLMLSTQFRKQADATGWDPAPCSAR